MLKEKERNVQQGALRVEKYTINALQIEDIERGKNLQQSFSFT